MLAFLPKKFQIKNVIRVKLREALSYEKFERKMLMKPQICDGGIEVNGVTVFVDKDCEVKAGENTEVVLTNLSRHTLDHQPILFQLGLPVR